MATKTKEPGTDLANTQTSAMAMYAGLEEYAGQGLDDLDAGDKSIPFIKVLEKNSPEVETVEGAKPGMFINTATLKLYSTLRFVPATRDHMFVEWVPIDNGGGLVASYDMSQSISQWAKTQRGKISLRNGNDLVETFYLYGIVLPEEDDEEGDDPYPAVIAFTSTRIKAYKTIVNRSDSIMLLGSGGRKFKAPWFCHVWRLGTEKKVDGNQSWYVYTAAFDSPNKDAAGARLPADHPVVQMGAEMVRQKQSGELKVAQEGVAGDQPDPDTYSGTPGARAGGGNSARREEEDPPF